MSQLAFMISVVAASIAKKRIETVTKGLIQGQLGNAIWLTLAAAVRSG
jgi:hypothetical protein